MTEPLTLEKIRRVIDYVQFMDRKFVVMTKGDGFLVQIQYDEPCVVTGKMTRQSGRKWYVSSHSTKSEVVRTCLKAAITSMEHVVREHFLYRGANIFSPHYDVDALVVMREDGDAFEFRAGPEEPK